MWFTKEQLWTTALQKVMRSGTSTLEKEIRLLLIDQFLNYSLNEVKLIPKDILELLKNENNYNGNKSEVIEIINTKWGFKPISKPGYYKRWYYAIDNGSNYTLTESKHIGRYYTFPKNDFLEKS